MKRNPLFTIFTILAITALSLSGLPQVPALAQDSARIQIVHLAPFAAGEESSVTVSLGGIPILTDFEYGSSTSYLSLDADTYLVEITPTGAVEPVISTTIVLAAGNDYTAVAVGDGANQAPGLILLEDNNTAPAEGMFHLRLGHLAPFAADLDDTRADVRLQDGTLILENVPFGAVDSYLPLPAGLYDLKITTPGGETTLIDPAPVSFTQGTIISAFAAGEGENQSLGVFALPAGEGGFFLPLDSAEEIAYLQVAHLAPFAEDASVTVSLNGAPALTNFAYGDSTGYLPLPAGSYLVTVMPTGTTTIAISTTVELMDGSYYTAVAAGDGTNQSLDLIVLEDDLTTPAAGTFHLRLGHLAPFASGDSVLADVRLQDGTPVLENVDFSDVSAFLPLPAGEYDLKITTPGGETTLIDPAPVSFTQGTIISAFAAGDGANQPLGVFALPSGSEGFFLPLEGEVELYTVYLPLVLRNAVASPASLRVVHASPDAPAVDVWVNGSPAITNLAFGEATGFIDLPAGTYNVQVVPSGATTPVVIEADLVLERATHYTVAATGLLAQIQPLVIAERLELPASGQAHVRFVHASPDAPAVDVAVASGPVLFENVAFREAKDYLPVAAGSYNLEVRLAGTSTVALEVPNVALEAGRIYTIFATGLAGGTPALGALLLVDY
jgi:trimeric autotransporter adhesin